MCTRNCNLQTARLNWCVLECANVAAMQKCRRDLCANDSHNVEIVLGNDMQFAKRKPVLADSGRESIDDVMPDSLGLGP